MVNEKWRETGEVKKLNMEYEEPNLQKMKPKSISVARLAKSNFAGVNGGTICHAPCAFHFTGCQNVPR